MGNERTLHRPSERYLARWSCTDLPHAYVGPVRLSASFLSLSSSSATRIYTYYLTANPSMPRYLHCSRISEPLILRCLVDRMVIGALADRERSDHFVCSFNQLKPNYGGERGIESGAKAIEPKLEQALSGAMERRKRLSGGTVRTGRGAWSCMHKAVHPRAPPRSASVT
jgi:hypothetical protein